MLLTKMEQPTDQSNKKPLALVIEDEDHLNLIFQKAVDMAGYDVKTVYDGQNALDCLAEIIPDLILLDLHLPKIQGEMVLNAIRADERLVRTRVILATADARLGDYLHKKVDIVLVKPIRFTQLRDIASRFAA